MRKLLLMLVVMMAFVGSLQAQTGTVRILFLKNNEAEADELVSVMRNVPKGKDAKNFAIRSLLAGPTDAERKLGYFVPYQPDSIVNGRDECIGGKVGPLAKYFIGVTVRRRTAIVNFKPAALCYLDTAITQADRTMNPIMKTLMRFKGVKGVDFAINGKVIEEWDA